ncbi:MAG: 4-phosphoerythronate dehydrogenase PdxB [Ignavibacteriales bacterium]|nr:4-phosphoerythronate dehydrogenase PdxB [Ignavibacteriales bacterium]
MKIVVDKKIPFINGVLEKYAEVVYLEGREISRSDLLNADALIVRTRTKCNKELLEGTPVRFIASATIGFDHIDTAFCESKKIFWTNAAGCNSSSVQQYIAGALVYLSEKLNLALAEITIGVVGVGNVGSKVAKLCQTIGMQVLLNDPPRERKEGSDGFVSLDTIVEKSDIITLHVPLNRDGIDKTFHMGDESFFSRLRKDQILINSSRGEVLDTGALKSSRRESKLAACLLDVWEHEPEIDRDLLDLVDIGTPHIAGYSADGKANGTSMSVQALSRFFGLDLNAWIPQTVPPPERPIIELDCTGLDQQAIFVRLVRHTYDILTDDRRLRESPQTFEKQRGKYPLRREFTAYTVRLRNASADVRSLARTMGFSIID